MPRKGIFFFATKDDMVPGLEVLEEAQNFKYIVPGLFDSPEVVEYISYKDLPGFGVSEKGNVEQMPRYLLVPIDAEVTAKEIPQRRGGVKYKVDSKVCLYFKPSGIYQNEFLIPGEFSPGEGDFSSAMYKAFRKEFIRNYEKVKVYSVGPVAYQRLLAGTPLTPSHKAKPEMYLQC